MCAPAKSGLLILTFFLAAGFLPAGVINFDDYPPAPDTGTYLDGAPYHGYNFGNTLIENTGGLTSSPNWIKVGGNDRSYIWSATGDRFNLLDAWVQNNERIPYLLPFEVRGYRNDVAVYDQTFLSLSQSSPTQLLLDFMNVDKVGFKNIDTGGYSFLYFYMDDVNLTPAVPEPSPVALLILPLLAFASRLRRRPHLSR